MTPHFLLFSQARHEGGRRTTTERVGGWWHFLLETVEGEQRLEAGDFEPQFGGERLELLAVVRGLEALDQPSRVTLVTPSRYVARGMRYGLSPWRENQFRWERFGELTPVKNADLWRRVDRALEFHRVECRHWRFDAKPAAVDESEGSGQREGSVVRRPHFARRRARASEPVRGLSSWLEAARRALGGTIHSDSAQTLHGEWADAGGEAACIAPTDRFALHR